VNGVDELPAGDAEFLGPVFNLVILVDVDAAAVLWIARLVLSSAMTKL
jgi:hypothetical protein